MFYEERLSDSRYAQRMSWSRAESDGFSVLPADSNLYLFVMKLNGKTRVAMGGALTKVLPLAVTAGTEWFGIRFGLGTFMPHLPASSLVNSVTFLPEASSKSFWLNGSAWQFPNHENADTFLDRLVHEDLLAHDPVIEGALQGQLKDDLSLRSIQRRFLHATGLTQNYIRRIERARHAAALLQQGTPILDTVYEAGYFDQPHLTRALKHFMGQTPAQIVRLSSPE